LKLCVSLLKNRFLNKENAWFFQDFEKNVISYN
jgi:hypothetical protein